MIFTTDAIALVALSGVSAQSSQSAPNSREMSQAASKLSYPPSRGSNPLVSRIGPCQAYERGGRIEYPLSGGRVSWNNIRDISNVQIAYSTEADPTSQDQFTPVGTNLTTSWVGSQCIQGPDFAGLGLAEGQQVTLQLSYQTGPGLWPMYECADLTLLSPSSFSALNMTVPCENNVLTTQTRSRANPTLTQLQADAAAEEAAAAQASISAHAASYGYTQGGSSGGSGSKLSATEAGVVGAMTTLGVAIIALLSARLFGVVAFGKRAVKERQEQVPRLEKSASYGSSAA